MGRTATDGLTYFNIDCAQEDNLNFIEAKFGIIGYGVWVKLLRKIYMIKGYYCEWSEKNVYLFAKEVGLEVDKINEIVETCLAEGLFHRGIFDAYGVLSSPGIQKRWVKIVTEAKRKSCTVIQNLSLLGFTPEDKVKTPEFILETPEKIPQKKGKEIKEKESKKNNVVPAEPSPPKKISTKKVEEEPEPFWKKLVACWFDFGKEKFNEEPSFAGLDPKILKRIVQRLKKRAESKNLIWDEKTSVKRLRLFLEAAYADDWLGKHFLLANLEKQFDQFIQQQGVAKTAAIQPPTDIQYLQEKYFEGKFDFKLIQEKHFLELESQQLVSITDDIIKKRIENLIGSNIFSHSNLCQDYQSGKQTPAIVADRINLMRLAVVAYFKTLKTHAA